MKKLLILTMIAVLGMSAYDELRPTVTYRTTYTVVAGDTLWDICNDAYIAKDNAECFNEFYYKAIKMNDADLQIGDTVVIENVLYK